MNQDISKNAEILYKEDLCREEVEKCICTIKEKNEMLGVSIEQYLKNEREKGMRQDVLMYFCNNIQSISLEQDMIYNLVSLLEKEEIQPKWYEWINNYCKQNLNFAMDDFMTLLQEAFDKNIPFESVKKIFESSKGEMFEIYEKINEYEETLLNNEFKNDELIKYSTRDGNTEGIDEYREKDVDYTDMFGGLLSVISEKRGEVHELMPVQEHLAGYSTSLQNFMNDFTHYSEKIVNEWQRDREENARIKSLYKMQQKLLESQQNKIIEMREEIFRLKGIIQEHERAELHRVAMSRKIEELHLLSGQDSFSIERMI